MRFAAESWIELWFRLGCEGEEKGGSGDEQSIRIVVGSVVGVVADTFWNHLRCVSGFLSSIVVKKAR